MTQLVDDQWLGRILRGQIPPLGNTPVFTTGYWYVRLCQAVLGAAGRDGVLSSPFNALPADLRTRAVHGLVELPTEIGLLSLRKLGPIVGQLRSHHDLNILGIEALAAAITLDATVFLSASSPRLEAALQSEGLSVSVSR